MRALLLLPFIGLLWVPFYDSASAGLFGFPSFYCYQLAWVPITAILALVPAAIMSIGAANLFTRNIPKAYINPAVTHAGEAQLAKITNLAVKGGALLFILFAPVQYALDLQLLGGFWILQIFPAVVFGLFFTWFRAPALLLGWAASFLNGSFIAYTDGLKPLHTIVVGGASHPVYVGLLAVLANVVVAAVANASLRSTGAGAPRAT